MNCTDVTVGLHFTFKHTIIDSHLHQDYYLQEMIPIENDEFLK